MPNAQDLNIIELPKKFLLLGGPGSGKSYFASSFPTPAFLFDFDKGVTTYEGMDFDYEQYTKNAAGWDKFDKDLQALIANPTRYKTVVIDTLSSLSTVAMEKALAMDKNRNPLTGGPVWNIHFGIVKNLIEGRLRQLMDLPCNIVVIGHIQTSQDEMTGGMIVKPLLVGSLATSIPGEFDEVYYATTKRNGSTNQYLLQTVRMGYYEGRSRISGRTKRLPDFVENDYNTIEQLIREAQNKKQS